MYSFFDYSFEVLRSIVFNNIIFNFLFKFVIILGYKRFIVPIYFYNKYLKFRNIIRC